MPPPTTRLRLTTLACLAGFLLLAIAVDAHWTDALERSWMVTIGSWRGTILTPVMQAVSWLASGAFEGPFAVLVVLLLRGQGRPRDGWRYLGWGLGGWAFYALLKTGFERHRPSVLKHLSGGGWYSFPSGHAMLAPIVFVFAALVLTADPRWQRWRVPGLVLAWTLSLAIAFSRVYLGVHYPSDVVAGLLIGSAWVAFALSWAVRADEAVGAVNPTGVSV